MMKITLFVLVGLAYTAAQQQNSTATVVKEESDSNATSYHFEYETSDGTSREEDGSYRNDTEQQGLSVRGHYKYVAPGGQHVSVTYVADKGGFQPKEQIGNDQTKEQIGNAQPTQQIGNAQPTQQIENAQPTQQIENAQPKEQIGSDQPTSQQ